MEKENLTTAQVSDLLNKQSGVYGLSGVSSDFRDLGSAKNEGNVLAEDAYEVFCYRVAGYIGRYTAAMNGVDAIVFTAGVGRKRRRHPCGHHRIPGMDGGFRGRGQKREARGSDGYLHSGSEDARTGNPHQRGTDDCAGYEGPLRLLIMK
jgi:hypothetical protein